MRNWLLQMDFDESYIEMLEAQHYTKRDLIEFVTREELINAGLP